MFNQHTDIPDSHRDLLDRPIVVSIATVNPDGQPQVTPVWADFDGEHVRVNTAGGRQKYKNLEDRPQATILAMDPQNPYRWMEVRGDVTMTREGAHEHINALSLLYNNRPYGERNPNYLNEDRVILLITPEKVNVAG